MRKNRCASASPDGCALTGEYPRPSVSRWRFAQSRSSANKRDAPSLSWRYDGLMISAVLFDLDETLLDRNTSLVAFLSDQHARFAAGLGSGSLEAWRDRFLALDARGHVHKAVVYPSLLAEFHGDASLAETLLSDYRTRCSRFARPFDGMVSTLMLLRAKGLRLGIVTNGETEFQARHVEALGLDSLVDAVLVSQTEGFRKPDAVRWSRLSEQIFRVDKWRLCRG